MPRTPVLDPEAIQEETPEEEGFHPGDGEDTAEAVENLLGMRRQYQDEQQGKEEDDSRGKGGGNKLQDSKDAIDAAKDAKGLSDKFGGGAKTVGQGGQAAGKGAGAAGTGGAGGSVAGAAGGTVAGAGEGAAVGAGGGATAGAVAGAAGGPAAPVTVPAGAAIGAVAAPLVKKVLSPVIKKIKQGIKALALLVAGAGMLACSCLVAMIFLPIMIILLFFLPVLGGSPAPAEATDGGGGSSIPGAPRGCPITGTITTPFGYNIYDYVSLNWHYGVDIGDGGDVTNADIHSTLEGTASLAYSSGGGYQVIVTHPTSGYSVRFLHMLEAGRVTGSVSVGDVIGQANNTGTETTAEHLHYEVYKDGSNVNPTDYMPAELNYTQPASDNFADITPIGGVWGVCNTLPEDVPVAGVLNYYILYADTSIGPSDPVALKDWAASNWGGNVLAPCPGGLDCFDYVIQQSISHGISPAFAITVWWEEGGFGGVPSATEFGCYPPGVSPPVPFIDSFNCFLHFTQVEHPFDPARPYESFYDWVNSFCGPDRVYICGPANDNPADDNSGFIERLGSIYDSVAPGKRVMQ